jgi:hypothetical protein
MSVLGAARFAVPSVAVGVILAQVQASNEPPTVSELLPSSHCHAM